MPPKTNVRAPGGKNTAHQRSKPKSLRDVYEDSCRENGVHPNSVFSRMLPEKQGSSLHGDTLDLSRNYLGDRGVVPAMQVLHRCPNVRRVILTENGLRNAGVQAACAIMTRHQGLTSVDFSDNYISQGAAVAIEQLLLENTRIVDVGITNTKFDVDQRLRIKELAATNAATRGVTA